MKKQDLPTITKHDRKLLPRFYAKTIANELNCCIRRVYNVASGKTLDPLIKMRLIDLINERRLLFMELQQKTLAN